MLDADGFPAVRLRDGRVLMVGDGSSSHLYDPGSGKFTLTGQMSGTQASGTATILADGRVLVVGGSSYSDEIYDPTSGTFSFVFTRTAGARPTATLLKDGRVLIVGGALLRGPGLYQP